MRRYLVVANQTLAGEPLVSRLRELSRAGPSAFFLIVPATPPRNHTWTEGEARATAHARLDEALMVLSGLEVKVEGEVGDGNPMLAIDDAIRDHGPFDEIILSTLPPRASRWLRLDLPHRVAASYGLPMTHIVGSPRTAAGKTGSLPLRATCETDAILTRRRQHVDIPQERKLITEVPGPRSREWFERRAAAVPQGVFNTHPIVTARASGAIIEDVDGNRLIDFATGIAVLNVGHTSPEVVAAAQRQLELDTHTCFHVTANEPYIELAERLNALAPGDVEKKTMFANSGAEAVENAVKIARKATGRQAIVTFDHSFHGRTLLAMSLTAKVMPYKQGMGPFAPEIYRLPFAYPYRWPGGAERCAEEALDYAREEIHKHIGEDNVAAVILEPVQGEGGFIVPAEGFVKGLAEFCSEHGILFIADEVQSGMGRAGRWFAIEDERVVPDLITSAKSLGGGLPISAVTGRADVMDSVHVGGLGGTYGGNPVAAAAALAVLGQIEREDLLERSRTLGEKVRVRLGEMQVRHDVIGDVRGRGMMNAIELVSDRGTKEPLDGPTGTAITKRCLEEGVVILKAGTYDNVIRLLPPLTIDEGLLDEGLETLDEAIAAR